MRTHLNVDWVFAGHRSHLWWALRVSGAEGHNVTGRRRRRDAWQVPIVWRMNPVAELCEGAALIEANAYNSAPSAHGAAPPIRVLHRLIALQFPGKHILETSASKKRLLDLFLEGVFLNTQEETACNTGTAAYSTRAPGIRPGILILCSHLVCPVHCSLAKKVNNLFRCSSQI